MWIHKPCAITFQWPAVTHWGRGKMAAIFQTAFSNAFSWMKMFEFRLKFHWSLFLKVQLTIFQHGSDNDFAPNRRQAIIWTNDDPVHRRIYASLGLNELTTVKTAVEISSLRYRSLKYALRWWPLGTCMRANWRCTYSYVRVSHLDPPHLHTQQLLSFLTYYRRHSVQSHGLFAIPTGNPQFPKDILPW